MRKKILLLLISIFAFSISGYTQSNNQIISSDKEPLVQDEVLVEFKGSEDPKAISSVNGSVNRRVKTKTMEKFGNNGFVVLKVPDVAKAVEALQKNPNVKWVSPNYYVETIETTYPNDSFYLKNTLWGLNNIKANTVWPNNKGNQNIYVGVIDEGIMYWHEDLCGQVWTNPFDPIDGKDNDGNGYIDDANGWDFFNNDKGIYDYPDNHGTHVSGTIGGIGNNNKGVIGVAPNVTLISAKFLQGSGSLDAAIRAIDYITDLKLRHGLNIVATNNSWGGGGFSQGLQDAIERSKQADILFIAAAGNNAANADVTPFYPSAYPNDNIISVASITSTDGLSPFSNYGATRVDIGAPGSDIISTVNVNYTSGYASYNGTSMATPHVTGAAVLYKTAYPNATYSQIKSALLTNARPISSLTGKCVTGGTLNIGFISNIVTNPVLVNRNCVIPSGLDTTPPPTPSNFRVTNITEHGATITWDIPVDPESGLLQTTVKFSTKSSYGPMTCTSTRTIPVTSGTYTITKSTSDIGPAAGQVVTFGVMVWNKAKLTSQWGEVKFKTLGVEDSTPPIVSDFNAWYGGPNGVTFTSRVVDPESDLARYRWFKKVAYIYDPGGSFYSNTVPFTWSGDYFFTYGKTYELRGFGLNRACLESAKTSPVYVILDSTLNTAPDVTPPSTPINLAQVSVTTNSIQFNWTPSTDDRGVVKYDVYYKKGNDAYSTTSTTVNNITISSLLSSTRYDMYVVAVDANGNRSGNSNLLSITTLSPPDITPPTTPINLRSTSVTSASISIAWSASTDNVGVTGYDVYYRTGSNAYQKITTASTSLTINSLQSSTSYDIYVVAFDLANNKSSNSQVINVLTSTPPPSINIQFGGSASGLNVTLDWDIYTSGTISSVKIEVRKGSTGSYSTLSTYGSFPPSSYSYSVQTPGTYMYKITVVLSDNTTATREITANIKKK